jgi:hypothetical protein
MASDTPTLLARDFGPDLARIAICRPFIDHGLGENNPCPLLPR